MIYSVAAVHTLPVIIASLSSIYGRQAGVCCSRVEDQDSSGEGGLSSNWWVLGSQGCPLSAPGDATLQTLSQSALSPLGSQNQQSRLESEHESAEKCTAEQSQRESCKRQSSIEKSEAETQGGKEVEEKEQKREDEQYGKNEAKSNDEGTLFLLFFFSLSFQTSLIFTLRLQPYPLLTDAEQQTRRVLRARGISSYTEQLFSDDESDENELEEWTDVEAVYAAPGTPADTSTSHAGSKSRHSDEWSSESEDSDQDWILPGSRKRKNKRPCKCSSKFIGGILL